jgi:DNA-binding HxlR family transcriptional regulator/GTPase SAR1 family protein
VSDNNTNAQPNKPINLDDPEILSNMINGYSPDPNIQLLDTVEVKGGRHKIVIRPYRLLNTVQTVISNDKIAKQAKLGFVFNYSNEYWYCEDKCEQVISDISRTVHRNISKKRLTEVIEDLKKKYSLFDEVSVVEYIKQKYPNVITEIEKDIEKFALDSTNEVSGYEKHRVATFLSVVSSALAPYNGIYRVHLILVGDSSEGKNTLIESVTKYLEGTGILITNEDISPNALAYFKDVGTYDGKVVYIDQMDGKELKQLLQATTKKGISKTTTVKAMGEDGVIDFIAKRYFIPGQAVFITTSVIDDMDITRYQQYRRFLKLYVRSSPETRDDRSYKTVSVGDEVVDNTVEIKTTATLEDKMIFYAYLLTRPKGAKVRHLDPYIKPLRDRIAEISEKASNVFNGLVRNLVRVVAVARGKTVADKDDLDFVMKWFKIDLVLNSFVITEREYLILDAIARGFTYFNQIRDFLDIPKKVLRECLFYLDDHGFVQYDNDENRTYVWRLDEKGRKLLNLIDELKYEQSGIISERVIEELSRLKDRVNGNITYVDEVKKWVDNETFDLLKKMKLIEVDEGTKKVKIKDLNQNVHITSEQK